MAAAGRAREDVSSLVARSGVAPIHSPVSTARKGLRRQSVAVPTQERADRRAASKGPAHAGKSPQSSSPVHLVLPSLPDSHLLNILSNIGVSVDHNVGSPSSLLSLIRLNEEAQAAIAKAKEAATKSKAVAQATGAEGVTEGSGPPPSISKKGRSSKLKLKSCPVPSRSSLRIKNLSSK